MEISRSRLFLNFYLHYSNIFSCDGTIKRVENPLESYHIAVILNHENEIEALSVDENNIFYAGDDHGGVSAFENGKFKFTLNVVEGVKSLCVEKGLVYTLLNIDLSIHEVRGDLGKYTMRASIPAKFPVTLFGKQSDGCSEFIAVLTRDGKGIKIVKNGVTAKFVTLTVKENLHEMIVNAMKGSGESNVLFSCDFAGKLIKSEVVGNELKEIASINTGSGCANCLALIDDNTVFVGSTDGTIKKIVFI